MRSECIPQILREKPQWILWRLENRNGEMTKLPFRIDGTAAKTNTPETWAKFDEVHEAYVWTQKYSGIGFVFAEGGGLCGIDLDGCRDPESGQVAAWAREIIKDFNTYSEVSPSGSGVKLFVVAKCPFSTGKNKKLEGVESRGGKDAGVEVYDKLRYFAVTGERLSGLPAEPQERQDVLNRYCQKWFPVAPPVEATTSESDIVQRARKYVSKMPGAVSGSGGHNATFRVACILVLGFGLSESDAMGVLTEWNSKCSPPWAERALLHKVQDASRQDGPRNYLRTTPENRWNSVSVPQYTAPVEPPQSTTLLEAASEYLNSTKGGTQKLISLGVANVDHAIGGGIAIGEMVVIAARPGHGKTCVGLQAAYSAAAEGNPVLIISEEMSKMALGKRALQFASSIPEGAWSNRDKDVLEDLEEHFATKAPIYVVESCGTAERARQAVERHVEDHGVKMVVVDYGQLLQSKGSTRYEQVTQTSITLRQMANRYKIAVIVLAQLNRAIEKRDTLMPKMGDLRDSGQIEQDADVILFLLWPHRIDSTKDPREFNVFVGKNRSRPIVEPAVKARFHPSRQMIVMENSIDADQAINGWSDDEGPLAAYETHR
jgi:KaiC/GvpD/RAD55 family RecA-like ATPase